MGGARIQVVGGIANRENIALGLVSSWTDNHEPTTSLLYSRKLLVVKPLSVLLRG